METTHVYYHVASDNYQLGQDLECWLTLLSSGKVTEEDWKWPDAPFGSDGDVVCVFEDLADAEEFADEFGGRILKITLDDEDIELHRLRFGKVSEGHTCIDSRIPAEFISAL